MRQRTFIGELELMIISAILGHGDCAYGVPICNAIEHEISRGVPFGSVYAALHRMEAKGWVVSELSDPTPERGGRAKRYFRITPKGLKQFRESKRALINLWREIPKSIGELA